MTEVVGSESYRADGSVQSSNTARVYKIMGSFNIGGAGTARTGFYPDARIGRYPNNARFIFKFADRYTSIIPIVTIDSTGVRWEFPDEGSAEYQRPTNRIIYGLY